MSDRKVLVLHRQYRTSGGEEAFIKNILLPALKEKNIKNQVLILPPLGKNPLDFLEVFLMTLGIERLRPSYFRVKKAIKTGGFTHILLNNFSPTISLKSISGPKAPGLKTLWWVHNSRFDCANGIHFNGIEACTRCFDNGSLWALRFNCQKSWIQSALYALAYRKNRIPKTVLPEIDLFICNSRYTEKNVLRATSRLSLSAKTEVVPMPVAKGQIPGPEVPTRLRDRLNKIPKPFYLYLGRITFDKGADEFARLARENPHRGFLMCGEGPMLEELKKLRLNNLEFGGLVGDEKPWLFKNCEALIIPSRSPETSSLVIAESNAYGTPVVYPRGGGAEETFMALGRVGCSVDEFCGQKFQRAENNVEGFTFENFADSVDRVING